MLKLDPAKKLEEYHRKNKPPVIRRFLFNVFIYMIFASMLAGILYVCKDFCIVWYETLMEAVTI